MNRLEPKASAAMQATQDKFPRSAHRNEELSSSTVDVPRAVTNSTLAQKQSPKPKPHAQTDSGSNSQALKGWRILVPRGGPFGESVAAALRATGAAPLVAPIINFAPADDQQGLQEALRKLSEGGFDWVTVTSATTVDVLSSYGAVIPETTKVAAAGETTVAALVAAGYQADMVATAGNSARDLVKEWTKLTAGTHGLRVLTLRSATAKKVISLELTKIGHHVEAVVAYRTIGVPVAEKVIRDLHEGRVNAVLVTSGSVAEQIYQQLSPIPHDTLVAASGPRTRKDAEKLGLRIDVVAQGRSIDALIVAVTRAAQQRAIS